MGIEFVELLPHRAKIRKALSWVFGEASLQKRTKAGELRTQGRQWLSRWRCANSCQVCPVKGNWPVAI